MPTARNGLGLAAASYGQLYAVGGSNSGGSNFSSALATVEEYDPAANSWATRAPMPTARNGLGLAAASYGQLYAVGGSNSGCSNSSIALAPVEEYDPAANSWATRAPMPTARNGLGLTTA